MKIIVNWNSGGRIDAEILHERESSTYLNSTSQLSFRAATIKHPASIHDSYHLKNFYLAGAHVDFDVRESATPRNGSLIEYVHSESDDSTLSQLASQNLGFLAHSNRRTHDQIPLVVEIRGDVIGWIAVRDEIRTWSRSLS